MEDKGQFSIIKDENQSVER